MAIKRPVTREAGRGDIHAADGRFLGTLPYADAAREILSALNDRAALEALVEALTSERDAARAQLQGAQTEATELHLEVVGIAKEVRAMRARLAAAEALPAKWATRQKVAQKIAQGYDDEGDTDGESAVHSQADTVYAQVIGELRAAMGGGAGGV